MNEIEKSHEYIEQSDNSLDRISKDVDDENVNDNVAEENMDNDEKKNMNNNEEENMDNEEEKNMNNHEEENMDNDGESIEISSTDTESEVKYIEMDGFKNDLKERRIREINKIIEKRTAKPHISYNSEFSQDLRSKFKWDNFVLKKSINYFYSECEFMRDKMDKAQMKMKKHLHDIHLDKRRQLRISYEYNRELARRSIERAKEEEEFINKQLELEQRMRQKEASILALSIENKPKSKPRRTFNKPRKRNQGILWNENVENALNQIAQENIPDNLWDNDRKPSEINSEIHRSISFLSSTGIEVTRDIQNPKSIKQSTKPSQIIKLNGSTNEEEEEVDKHRQLENNADMNVEMINVKNDTSAMVDVDNFANTEDGDRDGDGKIEHFPAINTLEDGVVTPKKTPISFIEIMKIRKRQREKEIQRIVNEPFDAYTRNSKGQLVKLDHPPVSTDYKEKSNKEKYKIRKTIGVEREKYQESLRKLAAKTEDFIEEEKRTIKLLNQPKKEIKKKAHTFKPRVIGPADWLKSFQSSNIPDNVDPTSVEALPYCRYIRAPLYQYSHLPNYSQYHTPL